MFFHIHFEFTPENRDAALKRFKMSGAEIPKNIKSISGPWFSVTLLEGWGVVEAEDATALGELMKHWSDLAVDHIIPVLSDKEVLEVVP